MNLLHFCATEFCIIECGHLPGTWFMLKPEKENLFVGDWMKTLCHAGSSKKHKKRKRENGSDELGLGVSKVSVLTYQQKYSCKQ